MSSIRENFDLDGDNDISGKDIDVLWAFLQTKTLAEKEWADNVAKASTEPAGQPNMCNDNPIKCSPVDEDGNITETVSVCGEPTQQQGGVTVSKWRLEESYTGNGTSDCPPCCQFIPTNFIEKMLDLYQANQDSGIAEDNTGNGATTEDQVSQYPGTLELGKETGNPQPYFLRRWTLDDLPNITQIDGADQDVTKSVESYTGKLSATLSNCSWSESGTGDETFFVTLTDETSFVEFDDENILNSSDNWTLHFKAKMTNRSTGPLFTKDNAQLTLAKDFIAFRNFVNKVTFFEYSSGETKDSVLAETELDFYIYRYPFGLKLFVDKGVGPQEYFQEQIGTQPEIFSDNTSQGLKILGHNISQLRDVWICDHTLSQKDILGIGGNSKLKRYSSYNTLDFTDATSRFAFEIQMQDKYDNFVRVYRTKNGKIDHPTWSGDTGYFTSAPSTMPMGAAARTNIMSIKAQDRYSRFENINMEGNFTLSFFIQSQQAGANNQPLFSIENLDPSKRIRWYIKNSSFDTLFARGDNLTTEWFGALNKDLTSLKTSLTHITLVKNRNLLGLWINGSWEKTYTLLDSDLSTIGTEARFTMYGHGTQRCADIVYLDYANSPVPVTGKFHTGMYNFIPTDMVIKEI